VHRLRSVRIAIGCSLGFFVCGTAFGQSRPIVDRFERTYRTARTLQATFLQRYSENGREVRSEAGIAYFGRPGKMRWEYRSPEPNLYVIDGKWSWFYVPADHTVTRIRAKESADWRTPLALLAGEMKVSRICAHVTVDGSTRAAISSNVILRCELRRNGPARRQREGSPIVETAGNWVLFEVNPANGELARILVSDPGGVQVEFRFASWQFDPHLDAKLFHFEPAKGIAIVDGELAASGLSPAPSHADATVPSFP
jgi:outer membrane lipoprotein carrier protein